MGASKKNPADHHRQDAPVRNRVRHFPVIFRQPAFFRPVCRAARDSDGADAIVFGCTGMLGFAVPVADAIGWAHECIIDPLPNAIRAAVATAGAGAPHYPAPERKRVRGFEKWTALAELMQPEAGR